MRNILVSNVLVLCAFIVPASATTRYVPSQYATIQGAINACANGDVVMVANGTYTGTGNHDIDFLGKAITVRSENGPESCIIDCQQEGRGFYFHSSETGAATLDGFKIINGLSSYGGGICCENASSTINNCLISENIARGSNGTSSYGNPGGNGATAYGGGIYITGVSSPSITNCAISHNSAIGGDGGAGSDGYYWGEDGGNGGNGFGGGIYCSSSSGSTILACTISENYAWGGNAGKGGHASYGMGAGGEGGNGGNGGGGGIWSNASNIRLNTSSIYGNSALGGLGGNGGETPPFGDDAGDGGDAYGGGIYLAGTNPIVFSSAITGNIASGGNGGTGGEGFYDIGQDGDGGNAYGGCFYLSLTNSALNNLTMVGNSANGGQGGRRCYWGSDGSGNGGALYCNDGSPIVENSIIWANLPNQVNSGLPVIRYSDIQGGYTGLWEGNININPGLVNVGYDFHLMQSSPCRDSGNPSASYNGQFDMDGQPRIMGGRIDMGSDEFIAHCGGLIATNNWDGKTINLSWRGVAGVAKIYRKKEWGTVEYITTVSSSSYTDTVPEPGKIYTYMLTNTAGKQISNEVTIKAEVIVVLVRGYSPSGDGIEPDSWKSNQDEQSKGLVPDAKQWFENHGVTCWDASSQLNGRKNIEWNSNALKIFISNLRVGNYANAKVNLVAHSMGGLTSRRYANENEGIVSNIFCIQTPHTGTPLADLIGWIAGEARQNLQYNFLEGFNKDYPVKLSANVYSFYSDNWTNILDIGYYKNTNDIIKHDIHFSKNGEQSDGAVPYLSGQGQRYKKYTYGNPAYGTYYEIWQPTIDVWPMTETMDIDFDHSTGHRHPDTLNKIIEWLGLVQGTKSMLMNRTLLENQSEQESLPVYYIAGFEGEIDNNTPTSHVITIGNSTKAYFRAVTSDKNCSFTLTDPCGVTYDPAYAGSEPNVNYEEEDEIFTYEVNSPVAGPWELNLTTNITAPNSVNYGLTVFEDSSIELYSYSVPSWVNTDANIVIRSELNDGNSPINDANIIVKITLPDSNTVSISLYDDGLHQDANANDGIYANMFVDTNQAGRYECFISAVGTLSGVYFERSGSVSFTVSTPDVSFDGDINDVGIDLNANGFYDVLRFNVPVDVNRAGQYRLTGSLYDSNEALITILNSGELYLATGPNTIIIEVAAKEIVEHNVTGPYILSDIIISDANTGLIIAGTIDYNTIAYAVVDFEQLDTDGDGLSDNLELLIGSNPNLQDSDFDGISDYEEIAFDGDANSYDPLTDLNPLNSDTDADGMGDGWELEWGFAPLINDNTSADDEDLDGLTNLEEYLNSTNPTNADTDGDGMPDGWEVDKGTNPLLYDSIDDYDADGLTNMEEFQNNTLPNDSDTDDDGLSDGTEIAFGTNPLLSDTDDDGLSDYYEVSYDGDANSYNPNTFHDYSVLPSSFFLSTGTGQGWQSNDSSWNYTLPFAFPYYGTTYTSVYVCSNGFLDFRNSSVDSLNTTEGLISNVRIAPLWDDLWTSPFDIYVDVSEPNEIKFRWHAVTWPGYFECNFSVTLFNNGNIRFDYGSSNTSLTPTVGLSAGNGTDYIIISGYDGAGVLTDVNSILFMPIRDLNALNDDTDNDGMTDGWEVQYGLNPLNDDTDGDSMPDGWEVAQSFNPLVNDGQADADSDGLINAQEYANGCNPWNSDTDGDGMPDGWEVVYSLNPLVNDAQGDADGDGLTNAQEYVNGYNPSNSDTDGDGMPDGWEVVYSLNPLVNDAQGDADGDGGSNLTEYLRNTVPNDANSVPTPIIIVVPSQMESIQQAIDSFPAACVSGDTVIVNPGIYYEWINFNGKRITLTSIDPNNPNVVASTIIDAYNYGMPVVSFITSEDANSILDGFTITNGWPGSDIYCLGSSPTIKNCIITQGFDAIYCNGSNLSMTNCKIMYNGCALRVNGGSVRISNSIISNNSWNSWNYGEGWNILSSGQGGNLQFTNCTFKDNINTDGYGLIHNIDTNTKLINCIVWNNNSNSFTGSGSVTATYCDIQDWSGGGTDNISVDPLFASAGGDYRLLNGSPCINGGDPNYEAEAGETDIDGNSRVLGGRIDIGAYEYSFGELSDFSGDGVVNFNDLAILAYYWVDSLCTAPDWCEGCDYDHSGTVDIEDLKTFAENWLWQE